LLFAATHASFVGVVAERLLPALAGQTRHTVTQLGAISFAFGLRFWLVRRYAPRRAVAAGAAHRRALKLVID
jgi:hypothetical protein